MKRIVCLLIASWLAAGITSWAQQPGPGDQPRPPGGSQQLGGPGGPPGHGQPPHGPMGPHGPGRADPLAENFFPPELLMQNQKRIGLTEEQQKYIREEIRKAQSKFTDLQWELQSEQETLASLVKQEKPDEKQVLATVDKLLGMEQEIKKTHLTLLVRIKNELTPEQQEQLRDLRRPQGPRGPMPPMGQPQPPR